MPQMMQGSRIAIIQRLVTLCGLLLGASACAQEQPITLQVDASDAPHNLMHAHLRFPAHPGRMTLLYPKWIPGEHGPTGPINNLVGVQMSVAGKPISWQRDPAEMYALNLDLPAGADFLDVSLDILISGSSDDLSATPKLVDINWNQVLLYPKGARASDLTYVPTLRLPPGWKFGTALPVRGSTADHVEEFAPVSLETLVDSPLIAGEHFRTVDLSPGGDVPILLHLVADSSAALEITPADQNHFSSLAREAEALFGSHHFRGYHFLLTLSNQVGFVGLEHHESSDNRVSEDSLTDPQVRRADADLLPHEMVHSWNGKYRRPADLATPDFQTPMKTELLWVYEGLTQYLGMVLTARSGSWTADDFCQNIAGNAAQLERQTGRAWRSLADTAVAAQLLYQSPRAGRARRRGVDFYDEGALIWLEADVLIRQRSQGKRSLDDFCRKFFGPPSSGPKVVPYGLDDVIAALNETSPYDWRKFFQERVYAINPHAPLGGIEGGGWRVAYAETPSDVQKSFQSVVKVVEFSYSLGFSASAKEETVRDVIPNSPADKAGIVPGMKLIAVNGRHYSAELLMGAIKAAKTNSAPIELLVEHDDFFKTCKLDYHDGEKYPLLERDQTKADLIAEIVKPLNPATTQPRS